MAVDYDLVILGGTVEGRLAAMQAANYGARVALIEQPGLFRANQQQTYLLYALQQLGQGQPRQAVGKWFGLAAKLSPDDHTRLEWAAVLEWSAIAAETQSTNLSTEVMSRRGVDVVMEVPERLTRQLVVTTASRRLRSRSVLAAFGLAPEATQSLMNAQRLPPSALILGGDARCVEWAQALSAFGVAVSVHTEALLPNWDSSIRKLVRSQLIAKGIQLLNPADKPAANDSGDSEIKVACTLAFNTESPALSLPRFVYETATVNELPKAPWLSVNERLQSAHPRVFACGALLGDSVNQGLANYEAKLAVKNALFLPKHRVDRRTVSQAIHQFAKIGLSETEAQKRYSPSMVKSWQASSANSADLSTPSPLVKICKLVCFHQHLVGIHLFGSGAEEIAPLCTTAIGQPIYKLSELMSHTASAQSLSSLIYSAASKASQQHWQAGRWRRDWSENWFNWRRSSR
ncbi:MAG: FAD-dependent oxidoreductase [Cyanobacteria bacterium J06597_16]